MFRLSVKSREIAYQLFEAFGGFLLSVLQCLNRREVSKRLLWDLVIASLDVTGEGIRQVLRGVKADGGKSTSARCPLKRSTMPWV